MTREEIATQFELAVNAYRNDPSSETAGALEIAVAHYMKLGEGFPSYAPTLAALDVLAEQWYVENWRLRFTSWAYRFCIRRLLTPNRPGWNDYWMLRWQLTGDQACVREIHRRAKHLKQPWPEVQRTARWMVESVRYQRDEFDIAMRSVEQSCGLCEQVSQ